MRAVILEQLGGTPTLADVPEPSGGAGVPVDVLAVALSPLDITVGDGRFALGHPPLPYAIGHEAVATRDGRPVYVAGAGLGITADGLCAERRLVPEDRIVPLPDDVDPAVAVSLGTAGVAGWMAVTFRAAVQPGERVAIRGASGAAGRVAVQAARAAGAGAVVGIGRAGARLDAVRELCDVVVAEGEDLGQRVTQAAGGPLDVLVDFAWGQGATAGWTAMAPDGRVVLAGGAAGIIAEVPSSLMISRRLNLLGYTNFSLNADQFSGALLTLIDRHARGQLRVDITTVAMDDAALAWDGTRQSTSKYVIEIQGGSRR